MKQITHPRLKNLPKDLNNAKVFLFFIFISVIGCRKFEISNEYLDQDPKSFKTIEAKEWWYGNFRKSIDYNKYNFKSPFYKALKSINSDISPDDWSPEKRFPSWKNSLTKTSGKLTIIELPLYSSLTISFVPLRADETTFDRERIAGATVHKVLIIRNNETNETNVRVLTIVPSISYMKGNPTVPLSYININTTFSGFIYIRDWNENLLSALKYHNGKRKIFDPFEKRKDFNEMRIMSSSNCDGTWDVVGYREFCITVHQADEPDPCDDPSNWGSRPIIGLTVPGDCDYGGEIDPCLGMSTSDCDCLITGICPNDEYSGQSYIEFFGNISEQLTTPCFQNVYDNIVDTANNPNALRPRYQQMLWDVFGVSDQLNIEVKEASFADTLLEGRAYPSYSAEFLNVKVVLNSNALKNASKEYIGAILIHEIFHALWSAETIIGNSNQREHSVMAYQIDKMADWLITYYPNLTHTEAAHLCWQGLRDTQAYSLLTASEKKCHIRY
jgi:hypothetical protein